MHGAFSMPKSSNQIKKKRAGIPACGGLCVCAATNRTRPALEEAEKEGEMSITFVNNSDEILRALGEACERGLFRCGEKAVEYAKDLCQVDTGNLRNSITHTVEDGKKAIVGTPTEYAIYQEMGTGKYAEGGGGRPTPWKYQDAHGIWHWTAGNRAHPFIKPSIADHQGTYKNILKDELSKVG